MLAQYEYLEVRTEMEGAGFFLDACERFGWQRDERFGPGEKIVLRRNRHQPNRAELVRLQRNLEACLEEIKALEARKTSRATAAALTAGIVGGVLLGTAITCLVGQRVIMAVMTGIPGALLLGFTPMLHERLEREDSERIEQHIEKKREEMYGILEKAEKLRG